MPRYVINPVTPPPKSDKLLKKLVLELRTPTTSLQPLILEEHVPVTKSRHVFVIWDRWKAVSDERRSSVIVEAYKQAEGDESASQITIASGVTAEEAVVLGLLPWKVVPARKRTDPISEDDYRRAFAAEANNTLLGAKAVELRYARLEDAEQ